MVNLVGNDGTWTVTDEQTLRDFLYQYFPRTSIIDLGKRTRELDLRLIGLDEEVGFIRKEFEYVIDDFKERKAGVMNGFFAWAVKNVWEKCSNEGLGILNECWIEGNFPEAWKVVEIARLPKSGGDLRPIWFKKGKDIVITIDGIIRN